MDIKDYSNTPEGIDMISSSRVFCLGGTLWQGSKGAAYRVQDGQVSTDELTKVPDVDGTMQKVWFRRHQRLEARFMRKSRELDERRAVLRRERNEIRESMEKDQKAGLPQNPEDLASIHRIDERFKRLSQAREEIDLTTAELGKEHGQDPPKAIEVPTQEPVTCPKCDKQSPPGKDPARWLHAHNLGAHVRPAALARRRKAKTA